MEAPGATIAPMSNRWASLRHRAAPLLLLAGGALAATYVLPQVPHERTVTLRLDDAPSVTGIDVSWTPVGEGRPADPMQGATWRFAQGKAPRALDTPVRLAEGRYTLDVMVTRGSQREEIRRTIILRDSDRVTISLR